MAIHPHGVQRTRPVALRQLLILGTGGLCLLQSGLQLEAGLPGDPDPGFQLDSELPRVESIVGASSAAGNHVIVVWPTATGVQVLKLDPTGKRVASFTPVNLVGLGMNRLAVSAVGDIYIGTHTSDDGVPALTVRRIAPVGLLDATFHCSLPAISLDSMTPLADGRLMLGAKLGAATDFAPSLYLHRLVKSGLVDESFELQGDWGVFGNVRTVLPKGDAGYVLMGPRLEKVSFDGTRDGAFVTAAPKGRPEAMAVSSEGGYVIAGRLDAGDGIQRPQVLRIHADGSRDEAFTPTRYVGEVHQIAVDVHGRVLIAGPVVEVDGYRRFGLARLNPEGGIDTSFVCDLLPKKGTPAFIIDLSITALGSIGDGRVYVTGNMAFRNGVALAQPMLVLEGDAPGSGAPKLAELPSKITIEEGRSLEISARPAASGTYEFAWRRSDTVLQTSTESLFRIATVRKSDAGLYRVRIASPAGSDEKSFEVDVVPASAHAGDIDGEYTGGTIAGGLNLSGRPLLLSRGAAGRLYVAGDITEFAGMSAGPVIALDRRGQLNPTFQATPTFPGLRIREVTAILATPGNEVYVAITLSAFINGLADRSTLLKLRPNGDLDKTFNHPVTFGSSKIVALGLDSAGRVLFARDLSNSKIGRLKSSGGIDTAFQTPTFATEPSGAVQVLSIRAVADKIYVAGSFNKVGDATVQGIARLLESGEMDPTYKAQLGGMGPVRKVIPTLDQHLVVALGSMPGLLLLDASGARVPTFQAPGSLVWAPDVDVDSEGRILVVTFDTSIPELPRAVVLRLMPDGRLDPSFDSQPGALTPVSLIASDSDDALVAGSYLDQTGVNRTSVVRLHGEDRQRVDIRSSKEGNAILRWASRDSRTYTIEESSGMNLADWKVVQTVNGTGSLLEWNSGTAVNSRFFRIRLD